MRWAGHVARIGAERKVYRILMGKPEGKRPLGRRRRRWEVGIKTDLRGFGWEGVKWIHLAPDRGWCLAFVNTAMNLLILAPRSLLLLSLRLANAP
jgi:hypothetical protein